jgi:hypothetical protein
MPLRDLAAYLAGEEPPTIDEELEPCYLLLVPQNDWVEFVFGPSGSGYIEIERKGVL